MTTEKSKKAKNKGMTQNEYPYLAYCDKREMDDTIVLASNTMNGLMDRVENWWSDYTYGKNDELLSAHHIDNTICIGDFQFLIYRR